MKGEREMLDAIAAIMLVVLVLSLLDLLDGAEASSQQCRDEVLKKHGHLF